ncbi:MAG TPA: peptidylprolyl isomerase [Gammaproteobacteria bacterium]|nr:peptidylprolyl isomerase [Gammaproteobacteria bacterium]
MEVAKHKVVTIDYTLTDAEGSVIDSSQGREPLAYIHGVGSIIPGLESALEGKSSGESLQVSIPPEQAYGERDDNLLQAVPKDRFEGAGELQTGMQFQAQSEAGTQVVTVVAVEDDTVTVDANHPLAGVTLNFDVAVVDVREATEEELSHGHVHGPEGHEHD